MEKILLLKYGELVLKGLNRKFFNDKLLSRVKQQLKKLTDAEGGSFELEYAQSTLCVRARDGADINAAAKMMKKVYGIVSVCTAYETEKDMDSILNIIKINARSLIGSAKSFKCEARRSDKKFPLTSPEICTLAGGAVLEVFPELTVDVRNPDSTVFIEVRDKSAFIHSGGEKGAGGMPNGTNGKALLLLSGGIDSPVAGHLVAKRGVSLDCVYFESPPYTSDLAFDKVKQLTEKLSLYCGSIRLFSVPVTEIQEKIFSDCHPEMTTILLRRFMMRLAERVAERCGAAALVTGESLGQVASQTMPSLVVTDSVAGIPVFRPCIGLDKEEIVTIARQIDTFETSSLPYEDCCTVFTPRHPNIRPTIEQALREEAKLEVDSLIENALSQTKSVFIN